MEIFVDEGNRRRKKKKKKFLLFEQQMCGELHLGPDATGRNVSQRVGFESR